MANPILQMLGNRSPLGRLGEIGQLLRGNPQGIAQQMLQSNPAFAAFVRQNQGKSPEQVARECGVDLSQIQQLFR